MKVIWSLNLTLKTKQDLTWKVSLPKYIPTHIVYMQVLQSITVGGQFHLLPVEPHPLWTARYGRRALSIPRVPYPSTPFTDYLHSFRLPPQATRWMYLHCHE